MRLSERIEGIADGTPILCKACGAPAALGDDFTVRCGHCGAADALPADSLGRAMEIKSRLALAASRAAQLGGMDAALARVFEDRAAWLRATGLYLAVGLLAAASSGAQVLHTMASLPDASLAPRVLAAMVPGAIFAPGVLLGGCLAVAIALRYGRGLYRRDVQPLLLARPPAFAGAPFGCRACGGPLPGTRDTDVACPFCRTTNLVPAAWHGAHADALFAEASALQSAAHGASARTVELAARVRVAFFVVWGVSVAIVFALGAAIGSRVTRETLCQGRPVRAYSAHAEVRDARCVERSVAGDDRHSGAARGRVRRRARE